MIDRRTLLAGSAALGFAGAKAFAAPAIAKFLGPETPFSFDALTGWAEDLSHQPFEKAVVHDPDLLERIDYDAFQEIKFRPELAIWADGDGPYPVELFHHGRLFQKTGPDLCSLCQRFCAGGSLQPRSLYLWQEQLRQAAIGGCGLCGLSGFDGAGRAGLAFLSWGLLFQIARRDASIWAIGARARDRCCDARRPKNFLASQVSGSSRWPGKRGIVVNALLDSPRITGAYRMEAIRQNGTS